MQIILPHARLLQGLQNAEFLELFINISESVSTKVSGINQLVALWLVLRTAIDDLAPNIKRAARAKETRMLEALDRDRDGLLIIVFNAVRDLARFAPDPEIRESAETVKFYTDNVSTAKKRPYPEETAMVTALVKDLELPDVAPHVEKIRQTENVALLKAKNEEFESLYITRNQNEYAQKQIGTTGELRKRVAKAFEDFTAAVEGLMLTETDADLIDALRAIVNSINAEIAQADVVYRRHIGVVRAKKREKNKGKEGDKTDVATQTPDN